MVINEALAEGWLCVKEHGMLIFATNDAKDWVQNCTTFFADGTFQVVKEPFTQLYTILADVGSV